MKKEIRAVLAKYPMLTMEGVNAPQGGSLLHSDALRQFELAVGWLQHCVRTKKPTQSSYKLKHTSENWTGAYCCNGAMIAAAIHLEFMTDIDEMIGTRHPNIRIGVGRKIP